MHSAISEENMIKAILRSICTALTIGSAVIFVLSCGSAQNQAGTSETGGGEKTAADNEQPADDPKVGEASTRCTKEIDASEIQPPDQLASIQVHACLYAVRPKIAACAKGYKRDVVIQIIVEKTGTVLNAFPKGDTADSPEAKCVAGIVKDVTFPKFKGKMQQVIKYPFVVGEK